MATSSYGEDSRQSTANYINKKGINELFEAMMTALMVHKPDDHINFMRKCLDKAENNSTQISWDFFVTKSLSSSNSSLNQDRQKSLPPIYSTSNITPSFSPQISIKSTVLPPIEHIKTKPLHLPIIFILSSSGSLKLCSKLLERYHQMNFLLINDVANIDEDELIDLKQHEYRYDSIQRAIERHRSQANGFLIVGELNEQSFLEQWQEKLGQIDLIFILSSDTDEKLSNDKLHIIQIDPNNEFENILATVLRSLDELFPQDAFVSQRSQAIVVEINHFNLPILFCIDNHRIITRENGKKHLSLDEEFEMTSDDNDEENSNSFIHTLCQRLAEQFSFKHIHYGDVTERFLNFEQLKSEIIQSMSTCSGYIIDHFPTSFDDLQRFQSEIGPCSALIYIGGYRTATEHDEVNTIIEKFEENKKALYVDCCMEVDEIYEDLKSEILNHI